ncbi:MAG: hypothetical protein FWC83_01565 [Alphaproteobacteria bacterium]|nr:hypothetical protein [Alphaproteobacteria bacterium]
MSKKQIEVNEENLGKKTVAKKASFVKIIKRIAMVFTIVWFAFAGWAPIHVKNTYGADIKRSMVVSMFFDLQRNLNEQYERFLRNAARQINLDRPIAAAIDSIKLVDAQAARAGAATAQATQAADRAQQAAGRLGNIAGRVGVNVAPVEQAAQQAAGVATIADDQVARINRELDRMKTDLGRAAQFEIDRAIDEQIRGILNDMTGLGDTLLQDYGIRTVRPWLPATWPITNQIYRDLEESNLDILTSLTNTINQSFGFVLWGLVFAAWAVAILIWVMVIGKLLKMIKPFNVCPRCGHTYADARSLRGWLRMLAPWNWFI